VYAFATTSNSEVAVFSSTSLTPTAHWSQAAALALDAGYTVFNTAVAKGVLDGALVRVMAIEVRNAQLGGGFRSCFAARSARLIFGGARPGVQSRPDKSSSRAADLIFATAPAAAGPWTLRQSLPADKGMMFGPGSCPAVRYDSASGFWHMLYTPNPTVASGDYRTWQVYAVRSKSLAYGSWQLSPHNPVMEADAYDRQIHNVEIPNDEQGWAHNTSNLNDSDPDLVEFDGQVLLVGNWGDQRTTPTNNLFLATYNGSMPSFWRALYDDGVLHLSCMEHGHCILERRDDDAPSAPLVARHKAHRVSGSLMQP
jgi:hypothetical protein